MVMPPNAEEIKEFQFKLHSRLRVFENNPSVNIFKSNNNLLATASRFGLLFVGLPSGFRVISTSNLQVSGAVEQKEYVHRTVDLSTWPSFLAVNADQTLLTAVTSIDSCPIAIIYDVLSLTSQKIVVKYQLRLNPTSGVNVRDLLWNPAVPNLLSFICSDGSAFVYELKGNAFSFNSVPPDANALCHSWSPKGKQVVIGSLNGTLTQYKPDLKPVKTIAPPNFIQNPCVVSVQWLSSFQFCVVYKGAGNPDDRPCIMIVNTPKNEAVQYINYDDICYSMGTFRPPQYYIIHQQNWNLLFISSANSYEIGVLAAGQNGWVQWVQEDASRAELPLDPATKNETYPVGFTLDMSSTKPIPWGTENQTIPPMPVLCILSHTGVLCLFHAINLLPNFAQICSPPEQLPDQSALQSAAVSVSEPAVKPGGLLGAPLPVENTQQTPEKQIANSTINISAVAPLTPQQNQSFSFSTPVKPSTDAVNKKLEFSFNESNLGATAVAIKPLDTKVASSNLLEKAVNPIAFSPASFGISAASATAFPSTSVFPVSTSSVASKVDAPSFTAASVPPQTQQPAAQIQPTASVKSTSESEAETGEKAEMKKQLSVANNAMYISAVYEEVQQFSAEMKDFITSIVGLSIKIGEEDEKLALKANVDSLDSFYKELKETTSSLHLEIDSLKAVLIETFSWIEEAKAREIQLHHPGYQNVIRSQELDPISSRHLKSINASVYYVESQLQQANAYLDSSWADFQDTRVQDKDKMKIPTLEKVYQAMLVQKNIFIKLQTLINELSSKIKSLANDQLFIISTNGSESINGDSELSKLAENLMKVKLNSLEKLANPCLEAKKHLMLLAKKQMLSSAKELKLQELLSNHTPSRIKPSRVKMMNGALYGSLNVLALPQNHEMDSLSVTPVSSKKLSPKTPTQVATNFFSTPTSVPALPEETISSPQNSDSASKPVIFSGLSPNSVPNLKEKVETSFPSSLKPEASVPKIGSTAEEPSSFPFKSISSSATPKTTATFSFGTKSPSLSALSSFVGSIDSSSKSAFSAANDTKVPEVKTLNSKLSASVPPMQNIFGGDASKSVPTSSFISQSKPADSGDTKENTLPEGGSSVTELKFDGLGFGSSIQVSKSQTPATNIFGGLPASKATTLFSGKADSEISSRSQSGTSDPKAANTFMTFGAPVSTSSSGTTPNAVVSSSPSNLTFKVNLATTSSSTTTASFNFGQAAKSTSSVFSWGNSAATVGATSTTAAPLSFSFSASTKAPATSTSDNSSIQSAPAPVAGSVANSSVSSTVPSQSTVFSFSSGQTTSVSTTSTPTTSAEAKPAFNFGLGLTISTSQPSEPSANISENFSSFSFKASQPSIFGGQTKPVETTTAASSGSPSIFGNTTTSSTGATNLFSGLSMSSTTSSSVFAASAAVSATTRGSSLFSTATTTTTAAPIIFGASPPTSTSGSSLFGTPTTVTTSAPNLFGSPATGTSLLGSPPTVTTTAGSSLFGTTPVTAATPATASTATTTTTIIFGTPTVTTAEGPLFGATAPAATTASVLFGASPTTSSAATGSGIFAAAAAAAAAAAVSTSATTSLFASATTTTSSSSVFGTPTTSAATGTNLFGSTATTTPSTVIFGGATATTTTTASPSLFGTSTSNLFGAVTSKASTSLFGSPNQTAANPSVFGSPTTTAGAANSSFFGQAICSPTPTTGGVFGQSPSVFGQANAATTPVFGGSHAFGSKPTFGQSGGALFGQSGSSFGQPSGGSIFGSSGGAATSPVFGQQGANTSGSLFGGANTSGGSFSTGLNQSVGQAGFGTPTSFQGKPGGFGSPPSFGATANFGGNPTFGAPPAFGPQSGVFGSTSPTSSFGTLAANQSSPTNSTFENLAKQNTVSFGNLAQNQGQSSFGNANLFGGSPQNNSFSKPAGQFGGSSFSSWR